MTPIPPDLGPEPIADPFPPVAPPEAPPITPVQGGIILCGIEASVELCRWHPGGPPSGPFTGAGTWAGNKLFPSGGTWPALPLPPCNAAQRGRQNIDNEVVRDMQAQYPNWPDHKDDICQELRRMYAEAQDSQTKQKIKQAMKRFGCDSKDRGAGDVRGR